MIRYAKEGDTEIPQLGVRFVWLLENLKGEKEFWISFDIRDYHNNYCAQVPVSKTFLINMIKEIEMREQEGWKYKNLGGTYQQGDLKHDE